MPLRYINLLIDWLIDWYSNNYRNSINSSFHHSFQPFTYVKLNSKFRYHSNTVRCFNSCTMWTFNMQHYYRLLETAHGASGAHQEAQLLQRNSASAVHVFLGWLADREIHWASQLLYNTPLRFVRASAISPCEKPYKLHMLRIGHAWSFKVILIGISWNPERGVVVIPNNVDLIFEPCKDYSKFRNSSISTTPLRFDDSPKNAFEYLQTVYMPKG